MPTPSTDRVSRPQPIPPLPPEIVRSGALFVESIAVTQQNADAVTVPQPDKGLSQAAKIAVAFVAVTALRAAVSWFRSRNSAQVPSTPSVHLVDPTPPLPGDVLLDLKGPEVLAITCHVTSDDVDLSALYAKHPHDIRAAIDGAVRSYFGPQINPLVVITPGSLWVRVVARVRTAWDVAGKKVKSTYDTVGLRVNLSELSRRIVGAITNAAKTLGTALKSPEFRAFAKTTYSVFVGIVNAAAAIAPILEFFGISGASELAEYIRQHLPPRPNT